MPHCMLVKRDKQGGEAIKPDNYIGGLPDVQTLKKMEQVEVTKADAEKKFERILKLVKRKNRGKKDPELVALVEDFNKQYQFLYSQYNRLKRESGKKPSDWKGNESYSPSASGSDSEYHSSREIETNANAAFNNDISNIQEELESALTKIADLNHDLASKTEENEALASDHLAALTKLQEIEIVNRDLRKEVDEKEKRLSDSETMHKGQVTELEEQLIGLKVEVDYLRDRKSEVDVMKQELDSLRSQKIESETLLERKSRETSQYLIQVKTLKEELARKSGVEQIMVEEKEGLQLQVMELESEVDDLRKQKNQLEDKERSNIREINRLREEMSHLNARILELEDHESKQIEDPAQIMTLKEEVELLHKQLDFMRMEKSGLELRIADQKRIMKGGENPNIPMESKSKFSRRLSTGTNFNMNVLERKMEDLAEEFRKKIEDNIRMLYQRIRVAEKIHDENKDVFKTIKENLEQENSALAQRLKTCEAELSKLRVSMESGKKALTESNTRLKQENGALGRKLAACEAELRKLRDEPMKNGSTELNSRLEQENGALRKKLANYEGELKKLMNTMDVGKDSFCESNSRLEQENVALREKLATCEAELRKSRTSINAGQNALAETNSRLEQENRKLREKVTSCEAELRKLRDSMEVCKIALNESNSRLELENGGLKEKLSTCETELRKSRDSIEVCKNALKDSNSKLAICEAELGKLRDTMENDNETEQLNPDSMLAETSKENESLKEKVSSLEAKLSKEGKENVKLLKAIAELKTQVGELDKITKEKDETLLGREEEKREAIRELCLIIDYHRSRCDHLWEMIPKKTNIKFLCV